MFLSTQTPSEVAICHLRQLAKAADKKGVHKEIKFSDIVHPYSEQIKDIRPKFPCCTSYIKTTEFNEFGLRKKIYNSVCCRSLLTLN